MHASMYEVNQSIAGDDREYEEEVELWTRIRTEGGQNEEGEQHEEGEQNEGRERERQNGVSQEACGRKRNGERKSQNCGEPGRFELCRDVSCEVVVRAGCA